MSVIDKAEDVTILALVAGAGLLLYALYKGIGNIPNPFANWTNPFANLKLPNFLPGSEGLPIGAPPTPQQQQQQVAASVAQAGGTPAQQASASAELANFQTKSAPLYWNGNGIDSTLIVPGTGLSIYELRTDGYTDQQISDMLNNAAANPSAYGVQPGDSFSTLLGDIVDSDTGITTMTAGG